MGFINYPPALRGFVDIYQFRTGKHQHQMYELGFTDAFPELLVPTVDAQLLQGLPDDRLLVAALVVFLERSRLTPFFLFSPQGVLYLTASL